MLPSSFRTVSSTLWKLNGNDMVATAGDTLFIAINCSTMVSVQNALRGALQNHIDVPFATWIAFLWNYCFRLMSTYFIYMRKSKSIIVFCLARIWLILILTVFVGIFNKLLRSIFALMFIKWLWMSRVL